MVGAVGIVLSLEAECAATRILHALLAYEAAVEEVACIELNARLVMMPIRVVIIAFVFLWLRVQLSRVL